MEYQDAANFLFDLRRFGQQAGTESASDLLDCLGRPEDDVPAVQIAGSNGKGSTARMTERVLREAGLSVGLFTSPHLEDLRERIRIDGRKIPKAAVASFVAEIEEHVKERGADGLSPTFFEATTVMALWQFAREDVDVAILEVGIGGKLDATSVVDPVASAVTTVTLEHTDVLGDTIEEIARDKAHVAPADRPLVTGARGDALAAIRSIAGDVLTVGTVADDDREHVDVQPVYHGRTNHTESAIEIDATGGTASSEADLDWTLDARIPTIGAYQAENAAIAAVLARQVTARSGEPVDTETIARGLRQSHWPGRFEVIEQSPLVVLDGAHNPDACERLADAVAEFDDEYEEIHLVFGAMHDKAHTEMAAALPTPATVTTCRPDLSRAADQDVLARVFERSGVDDVTACDAVADAVEVAIDRASENDAVLVTGSLYAIGEARANWRRLQIPKRITDLADSRAVLESAHVDTGAIQETEQMGVHRVIKTRLQKRQAETIRAELMGIGGDCAISGLSEQDDTILDVVMLGTLAQFEQLARTLDTKPFGLATFAADLRETLEFDTGRSPGAALPWDDSPAVMGILNVTPDSFHDGGEYNRVEDAVARAEAMVEAGASIVDVGGESTRPGAEPVSIDEEIDRVVPVIEQLDELEVAISVDTRKASVAEAALEAGADIINDVSGLEDPEMRFVAAEHDARLVVMHSIDAPVDPAADPTYDDVVEDVIDELTERVLLAEQAGLDREQLLVDPGLGFGKSAAESFELLSRLDELRALGCPIMVGHSHKSMFELTGHEHGERLAPTIAATTIATERGADVIRVHDVGENVAASRVASMAESGPDER